MNLLIVLFFVFFDFIASRASTSYVATFTNSGVDPLEVVVHVIVDGISIAHGEYRLEGATTKSLLQTSNVEQHNFALSEGNTVEIPFFISGIKHFIISAELIDAQLVDNYSLFYVVDQITGVTRNRFYDSRLRTFTPGSFCQNQVIGCEALLTTLGPEAWGSSRLFIGYSESVGSETVPILEDYSGTAPVLLNIPGHYGVIFRISEDLQKSGLDNFGFELAEGDLRLFHYNGAYTSRIQLMNTFAAPTGGTTYPITSEQASAFALSISSQNYFIA